MRARALGGLFLATLLLIDFQARADVNTWATRLMSGTGLSYAVTCVKALHDGSGTVIAGYAMVPTGKTQSAWLLKLDSLGMPSWSQLYDESLLPGGSSSAFNSVEELDSGELLAAGWIRTPYYSASTEGWIVRVDGHFGEISAQQQAYGIPPGDVDLTRIRPTKDGGYIAVGTISGKQSVLAMKLAPSLQPAWAYSYAFPSGRISDVRQAGDGSYIMVGSMVSFPTEPPIGLLVSLNGSGDGNGWQEIFDTGTRLTAMTPLLSQDGFVAVGEWADPIRQMRYGWIARFSSGGDLVWSETLPAGTTDLSLDAVALDADQMIYAAGTSRPPLRQDGIAVRVEPEHGGIKFVEKCNGTDTTDVLAGVDVDPYGGILWAGAVNGLRGNAVDALLLRGLKDGQVCQGVTSRLPTKANEFRPLTAFAKLTPRDLLPSEYVRSTEAHPRTERTAAADLCGLPNLTSELATWSSPQSEAVTVRLNVLNSGRDCGRFHVWLYFSDTPDLDSQSTLVGDGDIDVLAGGPIPASFYAMHVKGGNTYVIARVDPENHVPESNESDNSPESQLLP